MFVGFLAIDPFAPRLTQGALELTVLDCGKGEARFVVFPDGATMLVGFGGADGARQFNAKNRRWSAGEEVVSPYLWSRGVKRIDIVVLTGNSGNNLASLQAILENFEVGEFWHAPQRETSESVEILNAMAARGIPTRTLIAGDILPFSGASVQIISPHCSGASDGSVTLQINREQTSFLLSEGADNEEQTRTVIAGQFRIGHPSVVACGGVRPPEFVREVAIVSSSLVFEGKETSSDPDTLQGMKFQRLRTFHTGVDGATTVEWKDGLLNVRTYKHPEEMPIATEGPESISLRQSVGTGP